MSNQRHEEAEQEPENTGKPIKDGARGIFIAAAANAGFSFIIAAEGGLELLEGNESAANISFDVAAPMGAVAVAAAIYGVYRKFRG
jgi:hypothetical protein